MGGIFMVKIKYLLRNPGQFLLMTLLSIVFAFILGGSDINQIKVPTYIKHDDEVLSSIVTELEEEGVFTVEIVADEAELTERVRSGKSEFGLVLAENDFQISFSIDSHNIHLLEQSVESLYIKHEQYRVLEAATNISNIEEELNRHRVFEVETAAFQGEDTFVYERNLYSIFGFTLFFVIYTIAYSVFQILREKNKGIWDRMVISPVKKWEMYVANFLYSFLIGYVQVVIVFLVFRYVMKIDFADSFLLLLVMLIPYVLAIVALSIFIVSIVQTAQQFNAVIPIVSVGMAMIGGAYWPLEIVESDFMITLSKLMPITYGMELLNGVTVYNYSFEQMLLPISILLFMTVILTGIGIHFMERRYVS